MRDKLCNGLTINYLKETKAAFICIELPTKFKTLFSNHIRINGVKS